jgi:aldehyde dehydrogenase (NAD+)
VKSTPLSATVTRLAVQGHLLGDSWQPSNAGGEYEHRYAATGEVQAVVGLGGAGGVDGAVVGAGAAQRDWSNTPAAERGRILLRLADRLDEHADEAAIIAALDNGTPVNVMRPGNYAARWVRYYAGWCDKLDGELLTDGGPGLSYVRPEPYGVIAAIPPWNGSMMGMGQKVAPALAAGNSVVVKAPELAPFGMLRFAELALESGLPRGVLNVVVGDAGAGEALVRHADIDKITFTGGTATARRIMAAAAEHIRPVVLELGGKSANIVFPDADLDDAASMAAVLGVGVLSGQGCALPTRLYVHDDVYEVIASKVVALVEALAVGDPLDRAVVVGPVVTEPALERIIAVVERARRDGASLMCGGSRLGGERAAGYFLAPTVFGEVDHGSDLARNEVFGPVLAMLRFSDEDEVVAKANDSAFGLAAYVHTGDGARAQRVAHRLEAGTVTANGFPLMSPNMPFGGYKQSGFGREGGRAGIEEFVRRKSVHLAASRDRDGR